MRKDDLTQSPEENLIEYRIREAKFEKFHGYLSGQGFSINTARNLTSGLRQLFQHESNENLGGSRV